MNEAPPDARVDAVVIGGGFYGCAIAIYLAKYRGLRRIVLIEREAALMKRASYNNQARVHNGYHYPRSFTTAYRSRINLPQFVRDWPSAVKRDFAKVYAIARRNSKVSARQFLGFCKHIGARIEPAEQSLRQYFDPQLIEAVFLAEEYAFDTRQLVRWAEAELTDLGIQVCLESSVRALSNRDSSGLQVRVGTANEREYTVGTRYIFNCTYSGLNQLDGEFPGTATGLRHEITEMALIKTPALLKGLGITVMDGPFFSMMPFPARRLHTLSHVRYTPHVHWEDRKDINPYSKLANYSESTRSDRMIRDAGRYMPLMLDAEYVESLFEVKTVLVKNESDDGRPILFEQHRQLPGCYSILGGKIDNIYDVLEKLSADTSIHGRAH